jgi:hypothetical protein
MKYHLKISNIILTKHIVASFIVLTFQISVIERKTKLAYNLHYCPVESTQ